MGKDIKIKNKSMIYAEGLVWQKAGSGKIYLGSKDTGKYLLTKPFWRHIVDILEKPQRIEAIARKMAQRAKRSIPEERAIHKVKIMILLMTKHGLIKKIDHISFGRDENRLLPRGTKPLWLKFFFHKLLLTIYVFLACLGLMMIIFSRYGLPKYADFFWHERLSISLLTFFIFSWIFGIMHELVHYWTAASQGIRAKIRLSYRLNFLVFETYNPDIFSVPKFWRLVIYLSGMVFDLILVFIFYLIIFLFPNQNLEIIHQFILIQWLTFLWQFLFFTRTDFYFVIKELVGVENLYTYAIKKIYSLITRQPFDHYLTRREIFFVNIYTFFFFSGTMFAIVRYSLYHLPITLKLATSGIGSLYLGYIESNSTEFLDGLIIISIQILAVTLLIYEVLKKYLPRLTLCPRRDLNPQP